jgi:hypothetical protein
MKLAKIVDQRFIGVLRKLMKQPLPIKAAYKLKNIISKTDEEYEKYEELRKSAINKYANKNKDGELSLDKAGNAKFSDDNMKLFAAELNDLLSVDVEVAKLKIEDFGADAVMTAEDLIIISDILE